MNNPLEVLAELYERYTCAAERGDAELQAKAIQARTHITELVEAVDRLQRKAVAQSKRTSSVYTSDVDALRAALEPFNS